MDKKKLKDISTDADRWESGELGMSADHVRVVGDEEDIEIDNALGLQMISIRLNKLLIDQLKGLAKYEGMGYQPLIRKVLTQHVRENEHKLNAVVTAEQAAERAEVLFTHAVKCKERIGSLAPLSNERINAEHEYSTALRNSNSLLCDAYDRARDPILKRHIKLRLEQIDALCQKDLAANQGKNYGKAV